MFPSLAAFCITLTSLVRPAADSSAESEALSTSPKACLKPATARSSPIAAGGSPASGP